MPDLLALSTADPAFNPKKPVTINGYGFEPSQRKKFFIVFSPDGETPPKVVHATHKQAKLAAHHMANRHPGRKFYVMQKASASIEVEANG